MNIGGNDEKTKVLSVYTQRNGHLTIIMMTALRTKKKVVFCCLRMNGDDGSK